MKRQVKIDPIPFTKEGYEKLKIEKQELFKERVNALEHLKKAREMGDLKENGYYQASRQKLNSIDRRLRRLEYMLRFGVVIEPTLGDTVQIGSTITLSRDGKEVTYILVGQEEANPSEGRISHKSPIGNALVGRRQNENISIQTPSGLVTYKVSAIT